MSLRSYFIIVFGLSSIFFLFSVSFSLFNRMESIMVNNLSSSFQVGANHKIEEINQKLLQLNESFSTKTKLPLFNSMRFYTLTLNDAAIKNDIRQLELYFFQLVRESDELIRVRYIDTKAFEVFLIEENQIKANLANRSFDKKIIEFLKLNKNEIAQTIEYENDKAISLSWWVPVFVSSNKRQGIMNYSIDFKTFKQDILNMFLLSDETVCISDKSGNVLIGNADESTCKQTNNTQWVVKDTININNIDWSISISNNPKNLLSEVQELKNFVFFKILPIVSILSLIFIFIFSNKILIVIGQLVTYIKATGKGGSVDDLYIDINRNDELGILAVEMEKSAKLITTHRQKLEAKNNDLESYSYTLAHDLRSPLRSITSFSQILEMDCQDKLNEEELGFLNRIINASKRMSNLIDDILELSRLSNREISIKKINLSMIANSVIANLKETDVNKNFEIYIEDDIFANGDSQLFKIIFENLLGNAWKYSSKNETIVINFRKDIENGVDVYKIEDKGIGFDMKYSDKLFKPFQRLHSSKEFEGTGIGLASVKRMLERHSGKIWINSQPNKGTTVSFTLWQ